MIELSLQHTTLDTGMPDEKRSLFVKVYDTLIDNEDLSNAEFWFAVRFLRLHFRIGKPEWVDYSERELAADFRMPQQVAHERLKALIEKGYIEMAKGKRNRYLYRPTEKLTGESSGVCVMSSSLFDVAALNQYLPTVHLPLQYLQIFESARKRYSISTDDAIAIAENLAKAMPLKRGTPEGYIHSAARNITQFSKPTSPESPGIRKGQDKRQSGTGPTSGAMEQEPGSSTGPDISLPNRTTRALDFVDALNAHLPFHRSALKPETLQNWYSKGALKASVDNAGFYRALDGWFFYAIATELGPVLCCASQEDRSTVMNQKNILTREELEA